VAGGKLMETREEWEQQLRSAPDPADRCHAAYQIQALKDKRAASALIAALRTDPELSVRQQAALALGFLNSKRGIAPLIDVLLHDPRFEMREIAANALRWVSSEPRVTAALIEVMGNTTEEPFVREMVAEALGYQDRIKAAVPVLIFALGDESAAVRYWAAAALSGSEAPEALPRLTQLAATDTTAVENWGTVQESALHSVIAIKEHCQIELSVEEKEFKRQQIAEQLLSSES
jgi:HEAT repeat protein